MIVDFEAVLPKVTSARADVFYADAQRNVPSSASGSDSGSARRAGAAAASTEAEHAALLQESPRRFRVVASATVGGAPAKSSAVVWYNFRRVYYYLPHFCAISADNFDSLHSYFVHLRLQPQPHVQQPEPTAVALSRAERRTVEPHVTMDRDAERSVRSGVVRRSRDATFRGAARADEPRGKLHGRVADSLRLSNAVKGIDVQHDHEVLKMTPIRSAV